MGDGMGGIVFSGRAKWAAIVKVAVSLGVFGVGVYGGSTCAGNTTYQYDALGRVVKVTYPDSKQICYQYDAAGNRTQVKRQATGTCAPPSSMAMNAMVVNAAELAIAPATEDAVSIESYTAPTTEEAQAAQSSSASEN